MRLFDNLGLSRMKKIKKDSGSQMRESQPATTGSFDQFDRGVDSFASSVGGI